MSSPCRPIQEHKSQRSGYDLKPLDNAVKYTPAGSRVTVRVVLDDAHVVLSVVDTGLGFDEATAARLFDRFFRGEVPAVQARTCD